MSGRGFSLLEMLVALVLTLLLTAALLTLFRTHGRIVRRQTGAADLQQSLRIARDHLEGMVRVAGRGGLPGSVSVTARNNVEAGETVGGAGSGRVAAGSDVLIVRGVFESSVAVIDGVEALGDGRFEVSLVRRTPAGAPQELEALAAAVEAAPGEPVLLSAGDGSRGAVLELSAGAVEEDPLDGGIAAVVLELRHSGSELAEAYRGLTDTGDGGLDPVRATRAGLLEEHRFYVRREPDLFLAEDRDRLARARFYPSTDTLHPGSPSAGVDLVDHVLDLQVALGFDLDADGEVREGEEGGQRAGDEWLGNDPADDRSAGPWRQADPRLVRISVLARSARPLVGYLSPAHPGLEDHDYGEIGTPLADGESGRFLRGSFTSVVRRRNP